MSSDSHHPHDRYFKSVFAHLEVMEEYVQNFMPKELAGKFHLETLQKQPGSYVDNDLQEFFSDVVYTVRYGKSKVNITLLIEHKSSKPKYPWLQLLQYMVNAYTSQTKEKEFKKFSPVIPIILYHGKAKWPEKAVVSYFKGMDPMLTPFIPEFKYLLSDLSHYSSEELLAMKGEWVKRVFLALKMGQSGDLSEAIQLIF